MNEFILFTPIIPWWVIVLLLVLVSGSSIEVGFLYSDTPDINKRITHHVFPLLIGAWGFTTIIIIAFLVMVSS